MSIIWDNGNINRHNLQSCKETACGLTGSEVDATHRMKLISKLALGLASLKKKTITSQHVLCETVKERVKVREIERDRQID